MSERLALTISDFKYSSFINMINSNYYAMYIHTIFHVSEYKVTLKIRNRHLVRV